MADNSFTSSSNRLFFKQMAIVCLIILLMDWASGWILGQLYHLQKHGLNSKAIYAVEKAEEEVIIFGTSIAIQNYNPGVLADTLGLSVYNAGYHGQSIYYHLAVQEAILNRYQPKLFMLDLDPSDLFENALHGDRLAALLPFYREHEEMRYVFSQYKSRYEPVKMLSRVYPYNSQFLDILKNTWGKPKYAFVNGHLPADYVIKEHEYTDFFKKTFPRLKKQYKVYRTISSKKIQALKQFIQNAHDHQVQIVLITSPLLFSFPNPMGMDTLKTIAEQEQIPLFDYQEAAISKKKHLFHDMSHLNKDGAVLFSSSVAHRLNKFIQER